MVRGRTKVAPERKEIRAYDHPEATRKNNPPVGLVTPETDPAETSKTYSYDPHLDPQLVWAGKAERQAVTLPNVSLHVHERIDPRTIIDAVRAKIGRTIQLSLFESLTENPPLRQAIEFYQHDRGWSNRLVAGDSKLVMNSLLQKEGLGGQVQMIYIDPPYGVKYGSNFQPFVGKRAAKDGSDEDLTQQPEMVQAFRDTWELGIHSYLTYLRDRVFLARELLHPEGSLFVQISNENVHHVREVVDEIFGSSNFLTQIIFRKTSGAGSPTGYVEELPETCDYILWYARDKDRVKFRRLFLKKEVGGAGGEGYVWVELPDGKRRRMSSEEVGNPSKLPAGSRAFRAGDLTSQTGGPTTTFPITMGSTVFRPTKGGWKTNEEGMGRLRAKNRLMPVGNTLSYVRYFDDFPYRPLLDLWDDTITAGFASDKIYVVQTNRKVVERCILLSTDPGDLVFDPTCGSGTTAFAAEKFGRRWVTCDTSRVALSLAKQRMMTAVFDYYALAHPEEGIASGLRFAQAQHRTLKSIATDEPPVNETLYDEPEIDQSKVRVTGPFTVEAVPAPVVLSPASIEAPAITTGSAITRDGVTHTQAEWRSELLKTGVRGKAGQRIEFSRVEPQGGTRWLHACGETKGQPPQRFAVSFGSQFAPLESRQVELAWKEARALDPKPQILLFASFQFDPEAAKDIDELTKEKTGMTFLKVQMNTDLLTEDLKKGRSSNQSFWLIGQPDVDLRPLQGKENLGKHEVEVRGFDYYNTRTGAIESGGVDRIAMWMLDTDYDGRSLFPRQVFFPMAGEEGGWNRLAHTLKAVIDEALISEYRGTKSLPFTPGKHKRIAVLIVDDRGIESLRIRDVT